MLDETGFYAPSMAHNALPSRPWLGISVFHGIISVSYTHLDVYKRQAVTPLATIPAPIPTVSFPVTSVVIFCAPAPAPIEMPSLATIVAAVSYTHLSSVLFFLPQAIRLNNKTNRTITYTVFFIYTSVSYTHLDVYKRQR